MIGLRLPGGYSIPIKRNIMTIADRQRLELRLRKLEAEIKALIIAFKMSEIKDKEHECLDRERPVRQGPDLPRSDE